MPTVRFQITHIDTEKREQQHDENERRLNIMRHDAIENTFCIAACGEQNFKKEIQQHAREHRNGQLPDAEEGEQFFHKLLSENQNKGWRQSGTVCVFVSKFVRQTQSAAVLHGKITQNIRNLTTHEAFFLRSIVFSRISHTDALYDWQLLSLPVIRENSVASFRSCCLLMLFKQPVLHPFNTVCNKPGGAVVTSREMGDYLSTSILSLFTACHCTLFLPLQIRSCRTWSACVHQLRKELA